MPLDSKPDPQQPFDGYSIGIDTGGTFTDVVCRAPGVPPRILKVPSTPHDPSEAILDGIAKIAAATGIPLARIARLVHGTTVGTNAVLERKGAAIGLLTTAGFTDVLEIGRQMRDQMYDLKPRAVSPHFLVPGSRRKGVVERVGARGEVLVPLDEASVLKAAGELVADGVESIVVCYLFSFVNPAHELRTRDLIAEAFPAVSVSLSSEVDPNFREFERTVVTAFDAYIKPVIVRYLDRLAGRLASTQVGASLQLMQSRGGVAASAVAAERPVRLFLSGPAGGVIGARFIGAACGEQNLISIDIGGTSSDIALIAEGAPLIVQEGRIGGWPVRVSMVGVHAIGAGGGSIAWLDGAGGLRVGPHSAGAEPGPACYGRSGNEATVTDASIVLGYLNPDYFAAGALRLDPRLAHDVVARKIGAPLGLSVEQAALGIHRVVNAQMAEGIRLVSIQQGYDPRRFCLVPLGGGGPVHATALANELGMDTIVLPRNPGVLSAAGLLVAPIEHEVTGAYRMALADARMEAIRERLNALDRRAAELMALERVAAGGTTIHYAAEVCYVGQSHALEVPLDVDAEHPIDTLYEAFCGMHERVFGHATRSPATLVALRTTHRAEGGNFADEGAFVPSPGDPLKGRRRAVFVTGEADVPVYERERLSARMEIDGPAIVEQADTTTVVEPGWRLAVLDNGIISLRRIAR
jgi:N-methylhydantoinase A/oxoprolinase/acetone carboxylase beta subunit